MDCSRPSWTPLDCSRPSWTLLDCSRLSWTLLDPLGLVLYVNGRWQDWTQQTGSSQTVVSAADLNQNQNPDQVLLLDSSSSLRIFGLCFALRVF